MDSTLVKSSLDFQISEDAERKVQDIIAFMKKFEMLTEADKLFCTKHFACAMAIKYVYSISIGKQVGPHTEEDTKEIIDRLLSGESNDQVTSVSKEVQLETQNTFLGLKQMSELTKEMDSTGLLTVQEIGEVHKTLMKGLKEAEKCGNLRDSEVYTYWDDGVHYYPPPENVENCFYAAIDCHNMYMESVVNMKTEEKVPYIFKCAAWLLFTFVDIHPFVDGNGRLCRLLANYVLSLITPFPVSTYSPTGKEGSGRQRYIEAIVECRNSSSRHPIRLCEILIDSAWASWTNLFWSLEERRSMGIVPINIRQGSTSELIRERICRTLPKNVDRQMADTFAAEEAIKKADVSDLKLHQCVATLSTITVGERQFEVHFNVFPSQSTERTPVIPSHAI